MALDKNLNIWATGGTDIVNKKTSSNQIYILDLKNTFNNTVYVKFYIISFIFYKILKFHKKKRL